MRPRRTTIVGRIQSSRRWSHQAKLFSPAQPGKEREQCESACATGALHRRISSEPWPHLPRPLAPGRWTIKTTPKDRTDHSSRKEFEFIAKLQRNDYSLCLSRMKVGAGFA